MSPGPGRFTDPPPPLGGAFEDPGDLGKQILATLAYVAFGLMVAFGIWAHAVRLYQEVPDPRQLSDGYYMQPKAQVLVF